MVTAGPILLGVDGGNTKTVAVVAAADGTILGAARILRTSDIYAVPPDVAVAIHHEVADQALASAGLAPDSVSVSAAFSLAGADWPEDIALLEHRLRTRWPGASVVNDAIGALRRPFRRVPGSSCVRDRGGDRGPRAGRSDVAHELLAGTAGRPRARRPGAPGDLPGRPRDRGHSAAPDPKSLDQLDQWPSQFRQFGGDTRRTARRWAAASPMTGSGASRWLPGTAATEHLREGRRSRRHQALISAGDRRGERQQDVVGQALGVGWPERVISGNAPGVVVSSAAPMMISD